MGKVLDPRGRPGELVMARGQAHVWAEAGSGATDADHIGIAGEKDVGIILAALGEWSYVLWSSTPMLLGWVLDGTLRTLSKRL